MRTRKNQTLAFSFFKLKKIRETNIFSDSPFDTVRRFASANNFKYTDNSECETV